MNAKKLIKNAVLTAMWCWAGYETGRALGKVRICFLVRKQRKLAEQNLALREAKEAMKAKLDRADILFAELRDISVSSPEYKTRLQELDALMTEIENVKTELCNKLGVSKEEFFTEAV